MNRELLEIIRAVDNALSPEVKAALNHPVMRATRNLQAGLNPTTFDAVPRQGEVAAQTLPTGIETSKRGGKKGKKTNIERSIEAAMQRLPRSATLDDLIEYLVTQDTEGHIHGRHDDGVRWRNSHGEISITGRRGIEKHRSKYKR